MLRRVQLRYCGAKRWAGYDFSAEMGCHVWYPKNGLGSVTKAPNIFQINTNPVIVC